MKNFVAGLLFIVSVTFFSTAQMNEWIQINPQIRQNFAKYANGTYVICGFHGKRYGQVGEEGVIITSKDGVTWNQKIIDTIPAGILWANNKFMIFELNGSILTSPDGLNWTTSST